MENRELWERLNMDLAKHDEFLAPVPQIFTQLFLDRKDRPAGMGYFDAVVGDVHGIRVHELFAMKEAGAIHCAFRRKSIAPQHVSPY